MDERKEFKDALWDAIVNVFYEYNGKRGTDFGKEEVDEVLKENYRFFEDDPDMGPDEDDDDIYYNDEDDDFDDDEVYFPISDDGTIINN